MALFRTQALQAVQQARRGSLKDLDAVLRSAVDRWFLYPQPAPAAATDTATLTAAQLITGLIVGTPTAAASYTLPLATALEAALKVIFPDIANDDSFDFSIVNVATNAAFDITVVTNTGWTLVGGLVVESNEATATRGPSGLFRVRRTAANAYTLYRLA